MSLFWGFGVNEDAIFNITYSKAVPSVKIKLILEFPNYPGKKKISTRGIFYLYVFYPPIISRENITKT